MKCELKEIILIKFEISRSIDEGFLLAAKYLPLPSKYIVNIHDMCFL